MFDFGHWCEWTASEAGRKNTASLSVEFRLGKPSPKRGAVVNFDSDGLLLQFAFWETGEADFYGLRANEHITYFAGRILVDDTFEHCFAECMTIASGAKSAMGGKATFAR